MYTFLSRLSNLDAHVVCLFVVEEGECGGLDFILLSQFIKIVNIARRKEGKDEKINVDCKWSFKCEGKARFSIRQRYCVSCLFLSPGRGLNSPRRINVCRGESCWSWKYVRITRRGENECENTQNVPKVAFVPWRRYCTCRSGTFSATQD